VAELDQGVRRLILPAELEPLVLASASPRRHELLADAGWSFDVSAPDIDETPRSGEEPLAYCERLAREKARAGADGRERGSVLAGDTTVLVDGEILGKPEDGGEAWRMLRRLSGRTHEVASAVGWLHLPSGRLLSGVAVSEVSFDALDDAVVERYVEGGEWRGKAGGYALQGEAGAFARLVSGARDTVVGMPMDLVRELLRRWAREVAS